MTIAILMGVSGSGKTTVGRLLATKLRWPFFEGDDFHPPANVEKLRRGIPLTDEDRMPWLGALGKLIGHLESRGQNAVIACSALRSQYRDLLRGAGHSVQIIYLKGDVELIRQRLKKRRGHLAAASLLDSQVEELEEPSDAFAVSIAPAPGVIAERIAAHLSTCNQ
jgi:gluconokinase